MYSDRCDRADVFLRLAESYCRQLMERKIPPTRPKIKEKKKNIYQAPTTRCFFARSAFLDAVVLVNFMSA